MDMNEEIQYAYFALYYREMIDHLSGLEMKEEELLERDEVIPLSLKNEIFRHTIIINILAQVGQEKYKKEHLDLYKDGWKALAERRNQIRRDMWAK